MSFILSNTNFRCDEWLTWWRMSICLPRLHLESTLWNWAACPKPQSSWLSYNLQIWHIWATVASDDISWTVDGVPCFMADSIHNFLREISSLQIPEIFIGHTYECLSHVCTIRGIPPLDLDRLRDLRPRFELRCLTVQVPLAWESSTSSNFLNCCPAKPSIFSWASAAPLRASLGYDTWQVLDPSDYDCRAARGSS